MILHRFDSGLNIMVLSENPLIPSGIKTWLFYGKMSYLT